MEGNFERGYGPFAEFVAELAKSPARLTAVYVLRGLTPVRTRGSGPLVRTRGFLAPPAFNVARA